MQGIIDQFSIGRAADWLARVLGWSPLGRKIALRDAEGPLASLINGLVGTVVAVEGSTVILGEIRGVAVGSSKLISMRLTPRHSGWTPSSLLLTPIAVSVEISTKDASKMHTSIAIAARVRT